MYTARQANLLCSITSKVLGSYDETFDIDRRKAGVIKSGIAQNGTKYTQCYRI